GPAPEPGGPSGPGPRRRGPARRRAGGSAAALGTAGPRDGRIAGVRPDRPTARAPGGTGAPLPAHSPPPPAALGPPGPGAGPVRFPLSSVRVPGGARARAPVSLGERGEWAGSSNCKSRRAAGVVETDDGIPATRPAPYPAAATRHPPCNPA